MAGRVRHTRPSRFSWPGRCWAVARAATPARTSRGTRFDAQPLHLLDQPGGRHHRHPARSRCCTATGCRLPRSAASTTCSTISVSRSPRSTRWCRATPAAPPRPWRASWSTRRSALRASSTSPRSFGLTRTKEGAGNTVGYYAGVEPENGGFYMVLPLAGPSNARDAAGLMADYAVDPSASLPVALNVDWLLYSGPRWGRDRGRCAVAHPLRAGRPREEQRRLLCCPAAAPTPSSVPTSSARSEKRQIRAAELERRDNLALVR